VLGAGVAQLPFSALAGETRLFVVDGNGTEGPFELVIQ